MPIPIGVLAAAGVPAVDTGDMVLIGVFSGDDASTALDITNIPQTYKHLWLTGHFGMAGTSSTRTTFSLRLNSGTGISIWSEGVRESTDAMVGSSAIITNGTFPNYSQSGTYWQNNHFIVDNLFMHYSDTGKARKGFIFSNSSGDGITSSSENAFSAGETNATAINSLRISTTAGSVSTYTKLYLYGIKTV